MKKLFGTDGIRGEVNSELTSRIAYLTGLYSANVLAKINEKCTVVIGKDTRRSCDMLESALSAGLLSVGLDVILLGVVPTPAIPHLIKAYNADLGIMISASHNPAEFNGIKLFNEKGLKLSDEIENEIEDLIQEDNRETLNLSSSRVGRIRYELDSYKIYEKVILDNINLDLSGLKIIVDCANGSNYKIAPDVLESLGADVYAIGNEPNGININKDCGSTHLDKLKELVVLRKADIGIAFDGDADRVLAIDETGQEIDGDRILLALACFMKKAGVLNKDTVVATVMSNMGLEIALRKEGINLIRTQVGDRYVLETMLNNNFSLGGEQSGHIIIKNINTTGDGLASALTLLAVLKNSKDKASAIKEAMKSIPQVLVNVKVPNSIKYKVAELQEVKKAVLDIEDKLKDSGRVLLRASGTEPLLRVMVEGENLEEIEKYAEDLAQLIEKVSEQGE